MKTHLIQIGNSRGIRIPKGLIEESRLPEEVEIEVQGGRIVISPAVRPRDGWEAHFKAMAATGDDRLLNGDRLPSSSWDAEEWEW